MTPIPYDEMRRILGLPDVREAVHRERMARHHAQVGEAFNRAAAVLIEHARNIGATIIVNIELIRPSLEQLAEVARPKQEPPMWAPDPARTKRTKHKPSRRVK